MCRAWLCFPLLGALSLILSAAAPACAEPLRVVATIPPIHSLAAAVMDGAGTPDLLVKGASSEHTYALRPSDARLLSHADVVIRVSENLETFLNKPITTLSQKATVVTLADIPGMTLLPPREGGAFEAHHHETAAHGAEAEPGHKGAEPVADHDEAKEGAPIDPHLWLDAGNAALIADHLAAALGKAHPEDAARFAANAATLKERLTALDTELKSELSGIGDARFIVFHDAYHYFEARYGLFASGSITFSPERQPGAARLEAIRTKIAEAKSACVFSEPQFEPKLVSRLVEGTTAKTGTLDGLGANLTAGPDLYFTMMRNLAASLKSCLSRG
jgi:zinc transport system substrate-binding protein